MTERCKCIGMLSGGKWDKINESCRRVYDTDYLSPTITTCGGGNQEVKVAEMRMTEPDFRVRKYTPRECWRLMGFSDDDFFRAKYGREIPVDLAKRVDTRNLKKSEWKILWRYMRHEQMSNTQLYKQAGNSIVVNVLMEMFREML